MIEPVSKQAELGYSLKSETLRLITYIAFWTMVLLAVFLTDLTLPESAIEDSPLKKLLGFNNVCVYWDYSPVRELIAAFYPVVEVPLVLYLLFKFVRVWIAQREDPTAVGLRRLYYAECVLTPICIFLACEFRMIFVNIAFVDIVAHTIPFFGLQICLVVVAFTNHAYLELTGRGFKAPQYLKNLYLVAVSIVCVIKITLASSVYNGTPVYNPDIPSQARFAEFIDICWMLLNAVLPLWYAIRLRPLDHWMRITFGDPPADSHRLVSLNPETARLATYAMFWSMVILAVIMTKALIPSEDITESPLVQLFGYNNICVNWDYSPIREVIAAYYPLVEIPLVGYVALAFFRVLSGFKKGKISIYLYVANCFFTPILLWLALMFRMIFVVQAVGESAHVVGHTIGFFGLQVCLMIIAYLNMLYHYEMGTLIVKPMHAVIYLVSVTLVTLTKLTLATSLFVGRPVYDASIPSQAKFAHGIDLLWLVLNAVLPIPVAWMERRITPKIHFDFSPRTEPGNINKYVEDKVKTGCLNLGEACDCFKRRRLCCFYPPIRYITILILLFVAFWNFTKVPFYMQSKYWAATNITWDPVRCGALGPDKLGVQNYWCHGMEGSINVAHYIDPSYRTGKLYTDPMLFLAPHVFMGATVLAMSCIVLFNPAWQRTLAYFYFPITFIFTIHIWPAIGYRSTGLMFIFGLDTLCINLMCIAGYFILKNYDAWKPHSPRLISAFYWIITFGTMGAAYAEFTFLGTNYHAKKTTGHFPAENGLHPSPQAGISGYSNCGKCAWMGYTWIALWVLIVWAGGLALAAYRNKDYLIRVWYRLQGLPPPKQRQESKQEPLVGTAASSVELEARSQSTEIEKPAADKSTEIEKPAADKAEEGEKPAADKAGEGEKPAADKAGEGEKPAAGKEKEKDKEKAKEETQLAQEQKQDIKPEAEDAAVVAH